jgi:hypothetical protein
VKSKDRVQVDRVEIAGTHIILSSAVVHTFRENARKLNKNLHSIGECTTAMTCFQSNMSHFQSVPFIQTNISRLRYRKSSDGHVRPWC